jgi:HTH-type transcriptional regulator, sugar sensing transcriptional regulator
VSVFSAYNSSKMSSSAITAILSDLGLTDKEVSVYISTLELGPASLLEISRHCKVKRSTVYEVVPDLEARGLLRRTKYGKRFRYLAEDPRTISGLLDERRKRFEEALPQFMALYNAQDKRPKVFFYQGAEELRAMYDDTLRAGTALMNYTSISNLYEYLTRDWVDGYIARRVKYGIPTRIVAVDSPEAREWASDATEDLRQIRLVPAPDMPFSADVHIYGNKVIVATFQGGLFGLLIEDENIARMQAMMFELMWGATRPT